MSRDVFATDADGVIYPFVPVFARWARQETGLDCPLGQSFKRKFWRAWGIGDDQFHDLLVSGIRRGPIFRHGEPLPGAVDALSAAAAHGLIARVITSRAIPGVEHLAHEATDRWLRTNRFPTCEIVLCGHETKALLPAATTDRVLMAIDDDPVQVEGWTAAGTPARLFDQPWNQTHRGSDRLRGWSDLPLFPWEHST